MSKAAAYLTRIQKALATAKEVRVGFLEGATEPGGQSTAMVMAIQEYGAPAVGIPPRPFFRPMIKDNQGHWGPDLGKLLRTNGYDAAKSLGQMGEEMMGELRESIINLTDPPLSDVTLLLRERFGNSPESITFADVVQARHDISAGVTPSVSGTQGKPLIWTGTAINNVDKEVV